MKTAQYIGRCVYTYHLSLHFQTSYITESLLLFLYITGLCGHLVRAEEEAWSDGAPEGGDEDQAGLTGPL